MREVAHRSEAHQSPNLAWLVRLRWLALVSQAVAVLVVKGLVGIELSLGPLLSVVLITALSNLGLMLWLGRKPRIEAWMAASVMGLDFLLLTALLYLSGGPSNPFTVLYLVNIALAAVVLEPGYAWALSALSTACFGALFMLPPRSELVGRAMDQAMAMNHHHHHGEEPMSLHLKGMWVAFFVAATVIAYVVTRVTRDLDRQRGEAAAARTRALRSERLAALATLAAGAAHELATPLGTIAVVANELERELAQGGGSASDARLIRAEVERCKHILTQMASDAGESMGEAFTRTDARALVEMALEDVSERERVSLTLDATGELHVPARAWARALRGLIRNALQASSTPVTVEVRSNRERVEIAVTDRGTGMSEEVLARVGEPFFTTKEPGRGMGLGVFLARALAERMGGSLELSSQVGHGTAVRVLLPQTSLAPNKLQRST
jgi:two-component system sensor histidine kinase RegB